LLSTEKQLEKWCWNSPPDWFPLGTSSPLSFLSLLPAWGKSCSPCCFAVLGACCPDVDCYPRSLELLQVAWKRVVQQVLSLLGAAGAVQAHAFLALKMCAWCPWVSCWPKGACSCCPWRNCRVVKVMCCCPAAPAFPFHVAARRGLLHREKVPCGLFRSCRSCPSGWRGAASFASCCSAAFAVGLLLLALKGGTRKGRQEGRGATINFASCCSAAFVAGLVPHVCCIVVEKNLSK
jgi:hypothetical protein